MGHWIVGAALAALVGVVISYLSYLLSVQVLKKCPSLFTAVSVPRQIIQVGYLAAVYFLQPYTPWGLMELLVGAALGLTVAMFFFTKNLLGRINGPAPSAEEQNVKSGGDDNG